VPSQDPNKDIRSLSIAMTRTRYSRLEHRHDSNKDVSRLEHHHDSNKDVRG